MARVAWTAVLKPGMEAEYDRAHAEAWPSIRQNLTDSGARNFSIFRDGIQVFGYYECDDAEVTIKAIDEGEARLGWGDALRHVVPDDFDEHSVRYLAEVFRHE